MNNSLIGKKVSTKKGDGYIVGYNGNILIIDLEEGGTIQVDIDTVKFL